MTITDTILGLGIGLIFAFLVYLVMQIRLRHRISMVEAEFRATWAEQESTVRKDAAQRSRYVLKGKIAEHMVPLFSDVFPFDPSDARFIGEPIDFLIFVGYSAVKFGESNPPITVILADVKTGSAQLSKTERKIKEAVEAGRVRWETIRVDI